MDAKANPARKHILQTQRLQLVQMRAQDIEFVARMLADSDVMRFYPHVYTRVQAVDWLNRQIARYAEHGHGLWLVLDANTGAPIGQVGLITQYLPWGEEAEIGYLIDKAYWRRGYATEAALGVRRYAFDTLSLDRVISLIRPINLPSHGVARKLSMQRERSAMFKGFEHDVMTVSPKTVRCDAG